MTTHGRSRARLARAHRRHGRRGPTRRGPRRPPRISTRRVPPVRLRHRLGPRRRQQCRRRGAAARRFRRRAARTGRGRRSGWSTRLRGSATITYDPNIRPSLLADARRARARVESLVGRADIVKASDEDLRWLHPDADPLTSRAVAPPGPAVVVVTTGGDGAFAVDGCGRVRVPAVPDVGRSTPSAPATPSWAPSSTGSSRRALRRRPTRADLRDIASRAKLSRPSCAVARPPQLSPCSRPGADPPWRADLTSRPSPPSMRAASAKG